MSRLWHCFNCSTDFQDARDLCPKCGADGKDPRAGGVIAPRVVIHFDPPHAILKNRGLGSYACDATVKVGQNGTRATGDPSVVNCPVCRDSAAWKAAIEDLTNPPAYRVPVAKVAEPVPVTVVPEINEQAESGKGL